MNVPRTLDAHEVHDRLWVGSVPARGPMLRDAGFDVLVLCAEEFQFDATEYPGVDVIFCPFADCDASFSRLRLLGNVELHMVVATSRAVAYAVAADKRVLVTCAAGINRSALVAGLAMRMLSVEDPVAQIRARRFTFSLSNTAFRRIVDGSNQAIRKHIPMPDPLAERAKAFGGETP